MTRAIYDPSSGGGSPNDTDSLRAWCTIDLEAVRQNVVALHTRSGVPVVPMVKADAYGLGAPAIAHAITSLGEAVWALGVATPAEATALRTAGIEARLLCTSPVLANELPELAAARCRPALHRAEDIVRWQQLAPSVPWHLAIDTGMQRAGVSWRAASTLRALVASHPPEGVFTHFHSAERPDGSRERQEALFRDVLAQLGVRTGTLRHADNSWGVLAREGTPWDLVRPGFALYAGPAADPALHPVLHVHARIVDLRDVEAGDTVSYGATWTATRASRVATIGLGYGDGLRRALGGRALLHLHGQAVPIIGHITMDLTMLDVTEVPCALGDVVTVLGDDGHGGAVTLSALAAAGELSPYELLTGWRLRLPRVYRP